MARTPNYFPGQLEEENILMLSGSDYPAGDGEITYVSGSGFRFYEEGQIKNLGIQKEEHKTLRQLIHLAETGGPWGGFTNPVRDIGPFPFHTATIWWTDSTRTKKIVQKLITRNCNQSPATIQWQAFDFDGTTVIESMTDHIYYKGAFEVSRSRSTP